mgnify:CR=1 FL=1
MAERKSAALGDVFIRCENLVKIYKVADLEVMALQGLDLTVRRGEVIAIIGSSGSGKSTLLNVLGGLDQPSAGLAMVDGINLARISHRQRLRYRRRTVGFVWQNVSRNLIPYLTALENVEMPMVVAGTYNRKRAREILEAVGLGHRMHHRPVHMSGGEQQRVAIAIALANDPPLLLADEPTGSLDSENARIVLRVFNEVRDRFGVTVVIVTHDRSMAREVDRYVEIRDGKTSSEAVRRAARPSAAGVVGANSAGAAAGAGEGAAGEAPGADDASGGTHDEYTLLDSAGRLQLPADFIRAHGIKDRVRLTKEDGRIVITPPGDSAKGA